MTGGGDAPPRDDAARRREARLAEALRENLRRRKAQARERGALDTPADEPSRSRNPATDRA